jgi:bacteriorhodopsin
MENQNILAQLATLIQEQQDTVGTVDTIPTVGEVDGMYPRELGSFGQTCILIGLICMACSTAYFYMAATSAKDNKFFEMLTMMVTGIATVAYMTMFAGMGRSYLREGRPFFWARYVDWILTTPLMVWDVLALAGAPSDDIMMCVGVDVLMIAFGLVGAQCEGALRWVFFVVACFCFLHIVQTLLKYTRATKYGEAARGVYYKVSMLTIVLWTFYPVVWVLAEGTGMISPSLEACLYMIMDVTSKCLFGFMIVGARSVLETVTNSSEYQPILQNQAA